MVGPVILFALSFTKQVGSKYQGSRGCDYSPAYHILMPYLGSWQFQAMKPLERVYYLKSMILGSFKFRYYIIVIY